MLPSQKSGYQIQERLRFQVAGVAAYRRGG